MIPQVILSQKKYLIFDLDQTLAKLHIDWTDYRNTFYSSMTALVGVDLHEIIPNTSGSSQHLYNYIAHTYDETVRETMDLFCETWELEKSRGYTENRHLADLIRDSNEFVYYVWTANTIATAVNTLSDMEILDRIEAISAKETNKLSKPYPDGFSLFYDRSSQKKSEYLMVGDSEHDEQAAKAAGIDFFRVIFDPR